MVFFAIATPGAIWSDGSGYVWVSVLICCISKMCLNMGLADTGGIVEFPINCMAMPVCFYRTFGSYLPYKLINEIVINAIREKFRYETSFSFFLFFFLLSVCPE